jgi:hypothetical protein
MVVALDLPRRGLPLTLVILYGCFRQAKVAKPVFIKLRCVKGSQFHLILPDL